MPELKFDKKEWSVKYCRAIDLDELEKYLADVDYYNSLVCNNPKCKQTGDWFSFFLYFIMGYFFTFILLALTFSFWMIPILLIKGCMK
ncbi:MAG: hypothetical protein WC637_06605 [Victivallales bacterium]|jgi:hypothetical protein